MSGTVGGYPRAPTLAAPPLYWFQVIEMPVGSREWLIGEILSQRGGAVLLEPEEMRTAVAKRARELAAELGVSRLRVRA